MCTDLGCIQLFCNGVRQLSTWMTNQNQTDSKLAFWIREYLLHRGQVQMTNLIMIRPMSAAMYEIAQSQDAIGWTEFLHGKILTKMREMQQVHCLLTNTSLNGDNWMVKLTKKLIDISHSQWLYQNFTLHHYKKGYLQQRTEREIQREVERLMHTSNLDVPKESHYLLEIAAQPSNVSTATHNTYWVLAVKAARQSAKWSAHQGRRSQRNYHRTTANLLKGVHSSLQHTCHPTRLSTFDDKETQSPRPD
jgi:hypothetical protein